MLLYDTLKDWLGNEWAWLISQAVSILLLIVVLLVMIAF